jgi:hypothetical protein
MFSRRCRGSADPLLRKRTTTNPMSPTTATPSTTAAIRNPFQTCSMSFACSVSGGAS